MNDEIVKKFNNQILTQGSAVLKVLPYKPSILIFHQLPVREKVKDEPNRLKTGPNIVKSTSLDIKEFCKNQKESKKTIEGVIHEEIFET